MITKRLEFIGDGSSKYWEVAYPGEDDAETYYIARWGRIGTVGQGQRKNFSTSWSARFQAGKKIEEKKRKGYQESQGTQAPGSTRTTRQRVAAIKSYTTMERNGHGKRKAAGVEPVATGKRKIRLGD